jgi:hypothetical protein
MEDMNGKNPLVSVLHAPCTLVSLSAAPAVANSLLKTDMPAKLKSCAMYQFVVACGFYTISCGNV